MTTFGRTFLYFVYAAAVAGLTIAIVSSFRTSNTHQQVAQGNGSSQTQTSKPQPAPSTPAPSPKPSPSSPSAQPGTASGTPHQLNNTGPGDSIGLFVAVSVVGTLWYRRYVMLRGA